HRAPKRARPLAVVGCTGPGVGRNGPGKLVREAVVMSGPLPHWIERWLGGSDAPSGEGTAWSLDHSWPWPSWLTLLFVVGAAAWIVFWYAREAGESGRWRRGLLVAVRFALFGVVLFM